MEKTRNAPLDGLRGIAVLLVFFYHHGLLNSGWLGVDAFFALSGFLITGVLRRSRDSDRYWRQFWIKRSTRILPPLFLALFLTVALSYPLSYGQVLTYLLSLGDVLAYVRPHFEPLRPLWSLAVEEHFYLLWPFAIRYWKRRDLILTLAAVLAAEPLLRASASMGSQQWQLTYFLTPFRLDGLALGSLLAIMMEDHCFAEQIRRWCLPLGVCLATVWLSLRLLLGGAFTRDNPTIVYNALCYTLVASICSCGLAYLLTHPRSRICHMLSAKLLTSLGFVSYGLYLYQVPIREAVMRSHPNFGRSAIFVDFPLTLALAVLSYYGIERPAIRWVSTYVRLTCKGKGSMRSRKLCSGVLLLLFRARVIGSPDQKEDQR